MTQGNPNEFIGGSLNLIGVRPGGAFAYESPTMPRRVCYSITIQTSYEAIDKLILPPPLKADRSRPPELTITYFTNCDNIAFDGRPTPYQACIFTAHTEHRGVKGDAGWEYVDGIYGDKTEMDMMGLWGAYIGMLKKMADIHFTPIAPDTFEVAVIRRGVRLVTMRIALGAEQSGETVAAINAAYRSLNIFTVREIPSVDHAQYTDHAICMTPMGESAAVTRAFEAHNAAISFGHLEMDPFDEVPVVEVTGAAIFEMSVGKGFFTDMRVIETIISVGANHGSDNMTDKFEAIGRN